MQGSVASNCVAFACASMLLQVGLSGAPADPSPPLLAGPQTVQTAPFLEQPTIAQVVDSFPDAALRLGKSGSAVVHCSITDIGRLRGCTVVSETPAGYDFGRAALSLMKFFRLKGRFAPDASIDMPFTYGIPN